MLAELNPHAVRPRSLHSTIAQLASEFPGLRAVGNSSSAVLELSRALEDTPRTSAAQLIEHTGPHFRPINVPPPSLAVTHFLDGIQRSRAVAYAGSVPLVEGLVGAVIRERRERRLQSSAYGAQVRRAIYAPMDLLPRAMSDALIGLRLTQGFDVRDTRGEAKPGDEHPLRFLQLANDLVKTDREQLEREMARSFSDNEEERGVLLLDGAMPFTDSSAMHRMVGVIKSHNTLYVSGAALEVVLSLAEGQRSPVLAPEGRHRGLVASWYLRLRDASTEDPFFGLVRIEVARDALGDDITSGANERSAWVLAERSPLALPDGRWDTMAYGIRDCERFLRAIAT